MPIYEYRCEDCGLTSEFLVGPGREVNPVCQACGSYKMGRVMSAASILRNAYQRPAILAAAVKSAVMRLPALPAPDAAGIRHRILIVASLHFMIRRKRISSRKHEI